MTPETIESIFYSCIFIYFATTLCLMFIVVRKYDYIPIEIAGITFLVFEVLRMYNSLGAGLHHHTTGTQNSTSMDAIYPWHSIQFIR